MNALSPMVLVENIDGNEIILYPGDTIGRHPSRDLYINQPQISELHGYLRLRGAAIQLVVIHARENRVLTLQDDQRIQLAEGVRIQILTVITPEAILGLRVNRARLIPLQGDRMSILLDPPAVRMSHIPDAAAHLWRSGEEWMLQLGAASPQTVSPGKTWTLGEHAFEITLIPIQTAALPATASAGLTFHASSPLNRKSCRITRRDRQGCTHIIDLTGKPAELLREIIHCQTPTPWEVIAAGVWPAQAHTANTRAEPKILSDVFHANLRRLRTRLVTEEIDPNIIQGDGGHYRLVTGPGDVVEDWQSLSSPTLPSP